MNLVFPHHKTFCAIGGHMYQHQEVPLGAKNCSKLAGKAFFILPINQI